VLLGAVVPFGQDRVDLSGGRAAVGEDPDESADLSEEFGYGNPKSIGQLHDDVERGVPDAGLDGGQVTPVQVGTLGQLLLGPAPIMP
jgi:hypothetical protein